MTLKDENGNIISTTTTDENGKYQFDNLNSGNYIVHFDKPSGMTQTTTDSAMMTNRMLMGKKSM